MALSDTAPLTQPIARGSAAGAASSLDAWLRLAQAPNEAALLREVLPALARLVPLDRAALWLQKRDRLIASQALGFAANNSPIGLEVNIRDSRLFREVQRTHEPLYIPDVTDSPFFPTLGDVEYRTWLGVPIAEGPDAAILGLLVLERREPHAYQPEEVALAHQAAQYIAHLLAQHRRLQQAQQRAQEAEARARQLALLHQVISDLSTSLEPPTLWQRAARHLFTALQADHLAVLTWEDDPGQARLVTEFPRAALGEPGQPIPEAQALLQHLAHSKRLLHTRTPTQEPGLAALAARVPVHDASGLVVPVHDPEDHFYGAFLLWREQPFTADEMLLARTLAQQTASSLQNARLYNITRRLTEDLERRVAERTAALQREQHRAQLLAHIFAELASSLDLDHILDRTLQVLLEGLGAVQTAVVLWDMDTHQALWRAGRGRYKPPYGGKKLDLPFHDPWMRTLVLQRQRLLIDPDTPWPRVWRETFGQYPAGVAVPLLHGAESRGGLFIFLDEPRDWSEDDLDLIQVTAMQIATAIQNAELFQLIQEHAIETGQMLRQQQIEASRMRAILEAVADGILVTDVHGTVTLVNPSAERLLGIAAEDLLGQPLERFRGLFGAQGQAWLSNIRKWSQNPESYKPGEVAAAQIELEDGRVLSVHLSAMIDRHQGFIGTVSAIRDITHQIEVDRMKSEFVATVSHELRTPLTAIKGYVDLLLRPQILGELGPRQRKAIEVIHRHVNRLIHLVNDLLTLSRLESGRIRLEPRPVDLRSILQDIVEDFQRQMRDKGRDITVRLAPLPEDLPQVYADPQRVQQIVANLVENGCRYTPDGGTVTVGAQDQGDGFVRVWVQDTGIGIKPEDQPRIFERFYRGEHPLVIKTAGTGLGLSIVKQLVEMHGGRIWVESEGVPGQGSTFFFTLPVASTEAEASPTPSGEEA
ncbi:MAG: GAF domain-containing protein [Chloroflexi bacterium]|nr:GAF domain-containing protein [Chloroflexota bacterium]